MITTSAAVKLGFSRGTLKYLLDIGVLEKPARGVYVLPGVWEDEFLNLQSRFKKGIYSNETALFLLDLSDKTPNYYHMTFPASYNISNAKEANVKCSQSIKSLYSLGIINIKTPAGNPVKVYSMERTLCDVLRHHNRADIQIITDAFKMYSKRIDKNIPKLSEYGKLFRIEKKLRSYLEVLL